MKVVIAGAGEVGFHLAERLSREDHEVTVIESNKERHEKVSEKLNAAVLLGNGASVEQLEQANISKADLFLAVTEIDEVNMVSCLLARQKGAPRTIARVHNIEFTRQNGIMDGEDLGIEVMINPQVVVADEITQIINYPEAVDATEFAEGRVVFIGYPIKADSPFIGKSLKDLALSRGESRMVVTSIIRNERTLIPGGEELIRSGDVVYFVCKKSELPKIRKLFNFPAKKAKSLFIIGGGHVGYELVNRLGEKKHKITLVERNDTRAHKIADSLSNVLVVQTNATDVETLKSEGIHKADVIIAVTDDDETNILASLLAKRFGTKKAIALVNNPELSNLAKSLGIDTCLSPRLATASAILKYIRRGNVVSMIEQNEAEVLELQLPEKSSMLNKPIHSIQFPKGVIVGSIIRDNEVIIPSGDDVFQAEDRIIVFTLIQSVPKVEKFFS